MHNIMMSLTAMTGDDSKPFLVAVCLIVSVILMAVLIIMGKKNQNAEDESDDDLEE